MQVNELVDQIRALHRDCIISWKKNMQTHRQSAFLTLAEENHSFNYQLWHAEDRARRDDMGYEHVYHAKREIDHCNQQRNNRMEQMDEWLFHALNPAPDSSCAVHSETPGMMIDRLSILALKAYHMNIQTTRTDVDDAHRNQCREKLYTIEQQQKQLQQCLHELLEEVVNQTRTFRVYHQFKMYNDPRLNPELYQHCSD